MQVAIFMRGPFRPDLEGGLARARALADEVRTNGGNPSLFFATWSTQDRAFLRTLMEQPDVVHSLIIEPPPEEMIHEICGLEQLPSGRPVRNIFYQYYLSKIGLQIVDNMGRFDYVVHSRPDLNVRFGAYYQQWFEAGSYTTIHLKYPSGESFINDQLSVATPRDMLAVWDYGTLENLGALIRNSEIPEDSLDQMAAKSDINLRTAPLELWTLDSRRFEVTGI